MTTTMHNEISEYCANIGANPLLVQGAGGNVSWKDDNTLWVKASGMWLADAQKKNIFVQVNLDRMLAAVGQQKFDETPQVIGETNLRPSIETMLHALMPHKIVVHLHPVEILVWLVRADAAQQISSLANATLCGIVEYAKPGEQLAHAVHRTLANTNIDILFLLNHGVVIGGDNIAQIHAHLIELVQLFKSAARPALKQSHSSTLSIGDDTYFPIPDSDIQQLALDPQLYEQIAARWAICPDHVVFLGAVPELYANRAELFSANTKKNDGQIIFIEAEGVFSRGELNRAKQVQLRCYYDVMCRLPSAQKVSTLTDQQIAELLNWDAERYRASIAK